MLGTDPEYFIVDAQGKPVPAHRFFGDKHAKTKLGNYGEVFRDGYAMELNVTAFTCRESMALYVMYAQSKIKSILASKGCRILASPAVHIDLENDMKDAPADVLTFGCDPSWDAYTGEVKTPSIDAMNHEWRYAGGHMHISQMYIAAKKSMAHPAWGWMLKADEARKFIRMCDLYIGLPLTAIFESDECYRRRQYYGQAGEFRFQEYGKEVNGGNPTYVGLEYRTPGPEIFNDVPVSSMVFGAMRILAHQFAAMSQKWDASAEPAIQAAINTGKDLRYLLKELPTWYTTKTLDHLLSKRPWRNLIVHDFVPDGQQKLGWDYYRSVNSL